MPDETLKWSTQTDWDNATDRVRVVSRDIGTRGAHEINLGVDPNYGAGTDAVHYWHLDETSTGSGAEDAIGTANGTWEGTPALGKPGAFGSNAAEFQGTDNGEDAIGLGSAPQFGNDSSTTCVFMLNHLDADDDFQMILDTGSYSREPGAIRIQLRDTDRLEVLYFDSDGNEHYHTTFFYQEITPDPHAMAVRLINRPNDGEVEISVFMDGEKENVLLTDAARPTLTDVQAAIGRKSNTARWLQAQLSDVIWWNRALTDSEIDTIMTAFESGYLITDWKQSDNQPTGVKFTAAIDSGETLTCEMHQDASGDGTVDTKDTFTVQDGTNTLSTDAFDAADGAQYRLRFDLVADTVVDGPTLQSATINLDSVIGSSWDSGTDGVLVTDATGAVETV